MRIKKCWVNIKCVGQMVVSPLDLDEHRWPCLKIVRVGAMSLERQVVGIVENVDDLG